jgi:hypothetical protein
MVVLRWLRFGRSTVDAVDEEAWCFCHGTFGLPACPSELAQDDMYTNMFQSLWSHHDRSGLHPQLENAHRPPLPTRLV